MDSVLHGLAPDARDLAARLQLQPFERLLLRPDHAFLAHGEWRAFAAGTDGGVGARLVASVDHTAIELPRVGCVGFMALSPGHSEDARASLGAAMEWLAAREVRLIRAPVQYSTWFGHRAITDGFPDEGGAPPFPMEPLNRRDLVELLQTEGFRPAHRAASYQLDCASVVADTRAAVERFERGGFRDRPLRLDDLERELALLHGLTAAIFGDNWAFTSATFEEFRGVFGALSAQTDPELVRILEAPGGDSVGFSFAFADGPAPGTQRCTVKTLGVLPAARQRYPGIGVVLIALAHRAALRCGMRTAIHALMEEHEAAERITRRWGTPIRRYATFERAI